VEKGYDREKVVPKAVQELKECIQETIKLV